LCEGEKDQTKENDKHSEKQSNNSKKQIKEKRAKRNTIKQSKSNKKHMKEKEIKIREKTKVARQVSKVRSEFCPSAFLPCEGVGPIVNEV